MSSSSKVKALEKLQADVQRQAARALKEGEHDVARAMLDVSAKLEQKIQGHKAQRRKGKS